MEILEAIEQLNKINESCELKEEVYFGNEPATDDEAFKTIDEFIEDFNSKYLEFDHDCSIIKVLEKDDTHAKVVLRFDYDPDEVGFSSDGGYDYYSGNYEYSSGDSVEDMADEDCQDLKDTLDYFVNQPGYLKAEVVDSKIYDNIYEDDNWDERGHYTTLRGDAYYDATIEVKKIK